MAHSPVELLLTDSQGLRLGFDGQDVFEIPQGSYLRDYPLADDETGISTSPGDQYGIKTVYIPNPSNGSYSLEIIGVALGTYTVVIRSKASDGTIQTSSLSGVSNVGSDVFDQIAYSAVPGTAVTVVPLVTISSTLDDIKNSRSLGLITTDRLADLLSHTIRRVSEANGDKRADILWRFKDEVLDYSGQSPRNRDRDDFGHDRSQITGTAVQVLLSDADSLLEQAGYPPERGHH
jgi:hypothetical protein